MTFVQRGGGRLLLRLVQGVSAESTACSASLPFQPQIATPVCLWSLMGVRRMAGGEGPASGTSKSVGSDPDGAQPPPPESAPSRNDDPHPSSSAAASSSSRPSPVSPGSNRTSETGPASSNTSHAASSGDLKPRSDRTSQATSKPTSKLKLKPDQGKGTERDEPQEEELPENVHKYHAFWREERMRKFQPRIEEGMRMNAYEGLQGFGGFMRGPDQAWSYLYDSPSTRLAAAVLVPLWSAGVAMVRPLVVGVTGNMIRDEVDHSFETKEFVDSVSKAVPVFFEAAASADTKSLNQMCTPQAVEALERDRRRLREDLGLEVTRIDTKVSQATLAGGNLWGPDSIRAFDPAWASDFSPNLSKSWLVVGVYLDVSLLVSYRRVGGSSSGSSGVSGGDSGQEQEEFQLPVRRWGTWMMARGPLPKGPAESLDCPWKLLAWY